MSDEKIEEWVNLALQNEDISEYKVTDYGTSNKGDGYAGNIFFVTVTGKNKEQQTKTINLVIKASKESKALREQTPIKEVFVKEIFIYSQVLKEFTKLQNEMTTENLLNFMPHCYVTHITEDGEVLVFEDLKVQGYRLHDRMAIMSFDHFKLVTEAYGRWHAFSFALREKKRDAFDVLCKNNINMFGYFMEKTNLSDMFLEAFETARDACILPHEKEILDHLQFSKSDTTYIFKDIYNEDPEYWVVSHADCWNNNFLFKYNDLDTKPSKVSILDWQCSGLSSPVLDLSHYLYNCGDTGKYKDVSEFLKIYYGSFSKCLETLGCDAEILFPYAKLVEHWKRFSRFGAVVAPFLIKMTISKNFQNDTDLAETAEQGKEFVENFNNIVVTDQNEYYRRVRNNLLHYVENLKLTDKW